MKQQSLRQKLADKILSAAPPGSAFDQLVDEAVALYRESSTALRFPDSRNEKLSAKQYLADALAFAKTTVPKLAALEKRLAPLSASTVPWITAFRDGCRNKVRATRVDRGAALCCPTTGLHTLIGVRGGRPEDFTAVLVEANLHSTTPAELLALEVWQATRDVPDVFGAIDEPWETHHARLKERQARLEALYARISAAATYPADLEHQVINRAQSVVRVVFKRAQQIGCYEPLAVEQLVVTLAARSVS